MERVVPWEALLGWIEPAYPKAGNGAHTVTTTAANVADVVEIGKLLHGKEKNGVCRCRIHRR